MEPEELSDWKYFNDTFVPDSHVSFHNEGIHVGQMRPLVDLDGTENPLTTNDTVQVVVADFSVAEIVWIVLFTIMLSVAIFGNIIVIWIISCHRRMRTVTNYFLLNLSCADLMMAALNGAPNFLYMLRNDWILGKWLCVVNNSVAIWTVASCVFTMTAISIDRWMAIIKPLEPRMTKKSACMAIGAIWIGSGVLAGPALKYSSIIYHPLSSRTYCMMIWPDGENPANSKFEFGYNVILFILTYLIPMTAMAICYGWMSWELWGSTQIGEVTERQINSMISKRKIVRMFVCVVATFAICWLPYHGYFIYVYFDKTIVHITWIQHLYLSFYFLAMSQSSINPIIIVSMNSRFRSYICNFIYNSCRGREESVLEFPRRINYAVATPPLIRHNYSHSCSHSHSRSGAGEDNMASGKIYRNHVINRSQLNGARKKNFYINNEQEMANLAHNNGHVHESPGSRIPPTTLATRATYC